MMPSGNDEPCCYTDFDYPTVGDNNRKGYIVFVRGQEVAEGEGVENNDENDHEK